MNKTSLLPEQLSLRELEAACGQETANYRRARPSDGRFCLELFHRALHHAETVTLPHTRAATPRYSDEDARSVLVRTYTDYIKAHINPAATRLVPLEDLVQQVWLRFWQVANNGLHFASLEAALSYLRQTTITTVIEAQQRELKRVRDASLQQVAINDAEAVPASAPNEPFNQYAQQRFFARCRELLPDPVEYWVFWLRYNVGVPPREIARLLAQEGLLLKGRTPTARAISDLLERSCRRLQNDPEVRDLLQSD